MSTQDRAIGALLGLAAGDAVGTTLEFKRPGSFTPITDMVGGGPFGLEPGAWTDDTSMALCLAESLLDTGEMDLADQLRRYLLWRDHGYLSSTDRCFDIGGTTTTQLSRFKRTGAPIDPDVDEESAANGSLMRLAPVAIRWHTDPAEAAERSAESSRSTHPASRPVDACRVLGAMTAALINGTSADEVFDTGFWRWGALHPLVDGVAKGSWQTKEPPQIRGTGYCVEALEAAVWAVAGADDYAGAVLRAANLGDDADTTAAIAGQLAGARWGASGIRSEWVDRLVLAPRISELARGLFAAAVGDAARPARWDHDEALHAWWVEPGAVLAGEYPAAKTDPRRTRDKCNLLIDAGIRTFIDLTTPNDPLDPYAPVIASAGEHRQLDLRHISIGIPDLGVLTDDEYDPIVDLIDEQKRCGGVYVHCWGGVGRTGTVIGVLLARHGHDYESIMSTLEDLRAGTKKAQRSCPETGVQLDVLRRRSMRTPLGP
ncbi:MAG: ADP-ribosylglycohydrolase family protein [Actinomycetota bacterium]